MSDYHLKIEEILKTFTMWSYENTDCDCTAISDACTNFLKLPNLTEEMRKYLIGKRFEAEKQLSNQNKVYFNRFGPLGTDTNTDACMTHTAIRLGKEYGVSFMTVKLYEKYTAAVDVLSDKNFEMAKKMLASEIKISHNNTVTLSKMTKEDIKQVETRLLDAPSGIQHLGKLTKVLSHNSPTVSVKTMPDYDPDAELTSLALTIPSWVSSVCRSHKNADFQNASKGAKNNLAKHLTTLIEKAADTLAALREEI